VIGAAVLVGRIATGDAEDTRRDPGTEANRKGGLKGGKARATLLSAEQRKAIAKNASTTRWDNWVRIHKTLRVTSAMAAGLTDKLMDMSEIVALIDAPEGEPKPRGPTRS
jgi:hypothetical protein